MERLAEEHVVIHEHLVHVDELAARLDAEPDVLPELDEAVAAFAAVLRSHFTYEEDELSEPLGLRQVSHASPGTRSRLVPAAGCSTWFAVARSASRTLTQSRGRRCGCA